MSGKSHNPKRRIAVTCKDCQKSNQTTVTGLLEDAARALSACAEAGVGLHVKHGTLSCSEGLILQLDDGSFVLRTRVYTPFSEPGDADDD